MMVVVKDLSNGNQREREWQCCFLKLVSSYDQHGTLSCYIIMMSKVKKILCIIKWMMRDSATLGGA